MNQDTAKTDPSLSTTPFYMANWEVHAVSDRIRRGDTEIKLEPKVMAVLVCLADRRGELVTREQLEHEVWGGTVVGYDALTSSIIKLRKALGDNSRHPRFIETVSKKGYRLIAPVQPAHEPESPNVVPAPVQTVIPSRRMLMAGLVIVVIAAAGLAIFFRGDLLRPAPVVPDKPSIVVLPFGNLGNDPAQTYFTDGITADITTSLSKLSGLFVIASSSAQNYRKLPADIKQVAETLGVRYVLEGNVRRTGNRLRINVQLVDAATGFQLWAERYDRDMKDVLDVQDDVTAKIVNALSVELTEAERQRGARRYTINVEAYDEFLRGQSLYVRSTPEDNLQARVLFQQAIDRDPGFARAYGAMALSYVDEFRFGWGKNPATALERAFELANKAVALDDQLPQAYRALSYAYLHKREFSRAIDTIQRAIVLDPNDADGRASLALSHIYNENYETAIRMLREVMQQNPHYPARYASALGHAYYFLGRHEDAVTTLRDAIERNANYLSPHIFYTAALIRLGRNDEAAWAATQVRSLSPNFSTENVSGMFPIKDPAKLRALTDDLKRAGL
ncbi:MAG TPA: winged helix-turn-helix domain-containing protein, partial [Burkholderiales bacterium]|nr:winged helix-turn-helix domain-containing protein [Burkholderiales bacterium]